MACAMRELQDKGLWKRSISGWYNSGLTSYQGVGDDSQQSDMKECNERNDWGRVFD